jgi:hypothetical protein
LLLSLFSAQLVVALPVVGGVCRFIFLFHRTDILIAWFSLAGHRQTSSPRKAARLLVHYELT